MRKVAKGEVPASLETFISGQLAIDPQPVNLTYADFPAKKRLCTELTREQFGLCGYTGVPVDERLANYRPKTKGTEYRNHIEHLKSQRICRAEVVERGEEYGRVVGDDLNYLNMIAAIEVRGAETEHFGAVAKGCKLLPVLPIEDGCEERFVFREGDGGVEGADATAKIAVSVLRLDHNTLNEWRLSALSTWLDPEVISTREDFARVVAEVSRPSYGCLPEFAFVIESVARGYLNEDDF